MSWVGTPDTVGYNVTALGRGGDTRRCHSTNTSCLLHNMHCAETYGITVTAYSETCEGFPSTTHSFVAGNYAVHTGVDTQTDLSVTTAQYK